MDNYHMHTKENGSLVTFLVVGFVLAALVVGGVYTVQKRSQQSSPAPEASAPAEKKPAASPSAKPSTEAPASPKATPSQKPKPAVPSQAPSPSAGKSDPLPATGPAEDFLLSTLMFASFVGIAVAYIRSRDALRLAQQVD